MRILLLIFFVSFFAYSDDLHGRCRETFNQYVDAAVMKNVGQMESFRAQFFDALREYNAFYQNTKLSFLETDSELYDRAVDLRRDNQFEDSLEIFRKLIVASSDSDVRQKALFFGGVLMMKLDYTEDAIAVFELYLLEFPSGKYKTDARVRNRHCRNILEKEHEIVEQGAYSKRGKNLWEYIRSGFQAVERSVEYLLGSQLKYSIELTQKVYSNPQYNERIQRVSKSLLAVNERKRIKYSFKVLDQKYVNAFAVPGGFIYVTKGLMDTVESDDELAVVLAHEMGHIVAKHSIKTMERAVVFEEILNLIKDKGVRDNKTALRLMNIVFYELPYSRKNELEADRFGMRYAFLAGYDPYATVSFFNKLKKDEKGSDSGVAKMLRTHPLTDDRIKQCYSYIPTLHQGAQ